MARPKPEARLAGVFPAAITPHRPGTWEPDFTAALELMDFLAQRGSSGVCLLGSTGEFLHFDFEHRRRLVHLCKKRSSVPILVNVTHSTLAGALHLADDAIAAGADGLMIAPPYYFRYGDEEVEQFYRVFAREAGKHVPLVLYHIPQFTTGIAIETVQKFAREGLYQGIKDSSSDWGNFEALLELRKERPFAVFSGSELDSARALRAGADGLILANACALPEIVSCMAKAIAAGDERRATAFHEKLTEFNSWITRFPAPIGVKRAMELRGQKSGSPAIPLGPGKQKLLDEFAAWFSGWIREAISNRT
jgi:4-hydroxy-tetrahydrodipicolinate synthase